jgi:uncharacterized protein YbjT (DUF2867 family)
MKATKQRLALAGATGLIGSQVEQLASAAGHAVVPLSRHHGVDLTDPTGLSERLDGVDAVIDVTRPSSTTGDATTFFTTVAANLGAAARSAGVKRTVVLSIVGVDRSQDHDWYVATFAHEQATRTNAPGPYVLRATQFHEFPGQILARSRDGDRAEVMDMPTQPVESNEVARALVDLATTEDPADADLAGPRPEQLVHLVRRLVELRGDAVRVEPVAAPASMAAGSILPGPSALIRGSDWETWARRTMTGARP